MPDEPESTRDPRSSVIIRAFIDIGTARYDRRVRNLSQSGACVDHAGELAEGAIMAVTMGALGTIDAEVMWASERLAGVRFAIPVNLEMARKPRGSIMTPNAGWMTDIKDPHRRS